MRNWQGRENQVIGNEEEFLIDEWDFGDFVTCW